MDIFKALLRNKVNKANIEREQRGIRKGRVMGLVPAEWISLDGYKKWDK